MASLGIRSELQKMYSTKSSSPSSVSLKVTRAKITPRAGASLSGGSVPVRKSTEYIRMEPELNVSLPIPQFSKWKRVCSLNGNRMETFFGMNTPPRTHRPVIEVVKSQTPSPKSARKKSSPIKPVCWLPTSDNQGFRAPWLVRQSEQQRANMRRYSEPPKPSASLLASIQEEPKIQISITEKSDEEEIKTVGIEPEITPTTPECGSEHDTSSVKSNTSTPRSARPRSGSTGRKRRSSSVSRAKKIKISWNGIEKTVNPNITDLELQSLFKFDNQAMMYLCITSIRDKNIPERELAFVQDEQIALARRIDPELFRSIPAGSEFELVTTDLRAESALELTIEEMRDLRKQFDAMDILKTGQISKAEVTTFYEKQTEDILDIFQKLKKRKLDFVEEDEKQDVEAAYQAHEQYIGEFMTSRIARMMQRDITNTGTIKWEDFLHSEAPHVIRTRNIETRNELVVL
jgi:Ca2+-binding EF-hand superfamily protein